MNRVRKCRQQNVMIHDEAMFVSIFSLMNSWKIFIHASKIPRGSSANDSI